MPPLHKGQRKEDVLSSNHEEPKVGFYATSTDVRVWSFENGRQQQLPRRPTEEWRFNQRLKTRKHEEVNKAFGFSMENIVLNDYGETCLQYDLLKGTAGFH
jgi:hypothetical protein